MRALRKTAGYYTIDELAHVAPAIVATSPAEKVSDRFGMLSTADLIRALGETDWLPVAAEMPNARTAGGALYGRHMIRFRQARDTGLQARVNDVVPELVMFNAHDGTTAFRFMAGLYRFICANGMVVADATFGAIYVRHTGQVIRDAQQAALQVADSVPALMCKVEAWKGTQLQLSEQTEFATRAAEIRGMPDRVTPITARLLRPSRPQDHGADLWHTFNRVQEQILNGGYYGRAEDGYSCKVRKIGDVSRRMRVNRELWELADTYAQAA